MFKHIMIPVDGSELADKAVGEGLKLAKAFGAKVTALIAEHEYAVPTYSQIVSHNAVSMPEHERRIKEHAAKILETISTPAPRSSVWRLRVVQWRMTSLMRLSSRPRPRAALT